MAILRNVREDDYPQVIRVLNDWWGGRKVADMLPRLFFIHFSDTSYVVEDEGVVVAFLVGLFSQSRRGEAYIHFIAVDPRHRGKGLGRQLHEKFFAEASARGGMSVRSVTSPLNAASVAFHRRMGFEIEKSDTTIHGYPAVKDYDGPGADRVCLVKHLGSK